MVIAPRLRVGTDITSIQRNFDILKKFIESDRPNKHNPDFYARNARLARLFTKVYNRWEWPLVRYRFGSLDRLLKETEGTIDDPRFRSILRAFATWHAGRWAVKEATIKALWPAKIPPSAIAVLPPSVVEHITLQKYENQQGGSTTVSTPLVPHSSLMLPAKPVVLVRRPQHLIEFSPEMAKHRGLALGKRNTREAATELCNYLAVEANISHDVGPDENMTGFAVATVLADVQIETVEDPTVIVDDGRSEHRLHEPIPRDRDFTPWMIQSSSSDARPD